MGFKNQNPKKGQTDQQQLDFSDALATLRRDVCVSDLFLRGVAIDLASKVSGVTFGNLTLVAESIFQFMIREVDVPSQGE